MSAARPRRGGSSAEHLAWLEARRKGATPGTLRRHLYGAEGVIATDDAIHNGLRAWAVERSTPRAVGEPYVETCIVFGDGRPAH